MKHHETLVIRCDILALDAETSVLVATLAITWRSFNVTVLALDAETSARKHQSLGVTGNIGAEFSAIAVLVLV